MRRAFIIAAVLVVGLGGFYAAWPAWSARQISVAITNDDPAALERKIDFPLVRARALPIVAAEMERSIGRLQREGGTLGAAIAGQLKGSLGGKLAETAVETLLTPANIILMVRQGRNLSRMLREAGDRSASGRSPAGGSSQAGGPAGTNSAGTGAGPARQGQVATSDARPAPRRLGIANVKSLRFTGPLSFAVGLANDPKAAEADVIAEMAFTGGDWKVVGLIPRIDAEA